MYSLLSMNHIECLTFPKPEIVVSSFDLKLDITVTVQALNSEATGESKVIRQKTCWQDRSTPQ